MDREHLEKKPKTIGWKDIDEIAKSMWEFIVKQSRYNKVDLEATEEFWARRPKTVPPREYVIDKGGLLSIWEILADFRWHTLELSGEIDSLAFDDQWELWRDKIIRFFLPEERYRYFTVERHIETKAGEHIRG